MRYSPEYSSRFRILKGGRISLVVSAILMSSTLVHATNQSVGSATTSTYTLGSSDSLSITSSGSISIASGSGSESAIQSNGLGNQSITNNGTISISDTSGHNTVAGINLLLQGSPVTNSGTITNNNSINVTSSNGAWATGINIDENQNGNGFSIKNSSTGHISVDNTSSGTGGASIGINLASTYKNGTLTNAGDIESSGGFFATGIQFDTIGGTSDSSGFGINNTGTIHVNNNGASFYYLGPTNASANGIMGNSMRGTASISNTNLIEATSDFGTARGIYVNYEMADQTSIINSGTISAHSHENGIIGIPVPSNAFGIDVTRLAGSDAMTGSAHILNSGTIMAHSENGTAAGIYVEKIMKDSTSIQNSGTITVNTDALSSIPYTYLSGSGIAVYHMQNNASITNSGTITVNSTTINNYSLSAAAYGINAYIMHDDASILNSKTITVNTANANGIGIASGYMYGNSSITNSGTINVTAERYGNAKGIAVGHMYDNSSITNSSNSKIIVSSEGNRAMGIYAANTYGNSSISNNGSITVASTDFNGNGGGAYGISAGLMYEYSSITNSGNITVSSTSGNAYGIYIAEMHDMSSISNSKNIIVKSTNGGDAYGIKIGYVYDSPTITNSGTISVNSVGSKSVGIYAYSEGSGDYVTINNSGTIKATIGGTLDKNAYALYLKGGGYHVVNNYNNGKIYGNVYVEGTVTNAGLISLPYNANQDFGGNSAYVTNFTNQTGSTLEIGLMSDSSGTITGHSQLRADTATFEDGSNIKVNVLTASANQSLLVGQRLNDVVSATTLDVQGALNITDNSILLNFQLINDVNSVSDGHTIDLAVVEGSTIAEATHLGGGGGTDSTAAAALDNAPGMAPFIAALNNCETNECVAKGVASTTPQTHVSTQVAGTQIMNNVQGIVELRQNSTLGGGMNSGDKGLAEQNLWVKPFVSTGNQDNKDGINGFGFKMRGMGIGYDAEYAPNQRAGVALFVTDADVDVNNMNQKSDVRVYNILAYGNVPLDVTNNFLYQAGYAWQKNEGQRYIGLVNQTAHSDYTSQAATIDLKLMQTHKLDDRLTIHPLAEATYRRFMMPSYDETGAGVLNLHVDDATSNHYLLGGGMITDYKLDSKSYVMLDLNLMYDFNHGVETVTAAYEGAAGVKFTSNGIDNGPWVYNAGVGYTMKTNENSELNFMYNYQGQGNSFDVHTLSAKYVWKF